MPGFPSSPEAADRYAAGRNSPAANEMHAMMIADGDKYVDLCS